MQTVAEGIEEPEQVERLLALGCRYGQGYHYGRPMPGEQMTEYLSVAFEAAGAADSSLQADRGSAAVRG